MGEDRRVILALVANPASGTDTDVDSLTAALVRRGAEVRAFAIHDADAAGDAGADRLVVAGGDGSVGLAAQVAARAGVPLAVVPTGTANDFARALGLPRDREAALALAAHPGAATRPLDLAFAEDRPFVNAASVGLSVAAARRAHALKAMLGPVAYGLGALRAGLVSSPVWCRVTCDGTLCFHGWAWQATVAATGHFGGGSEVGDLPLEDGLLDAAVIEAGSRARLVRYAYAMRAGRLIDERGVRHGRGREILVEVPSGAPFNVDGELCAVSPGRFSVRRRALSVVVP
jgi:diacylglycerol kinase (ATP)